jgi:hypothetical protein
MFDIEEYMDLKDLDENYADGASDYYGTAFEHIAKESGNKFFENALIELRFDPAERDG